MRSRSHFLSLTALCAMLAFLLVAAPQSSVQAMFGETCEGDLDADGVVGVTDFLAVLSDFGCESECSGDVDGDGDTDVHDFLGVLSNWGLCDGSSQCMTNGDCDDGDDCTIDVCIAGVCHHFPDPTCD